MPKREDFHLRPIQPHDSSLILNWRNQGRVRQNMYSDHVIDGEEHAKWFQGALQSISSRYLILEYQGRPVGFVSFSGIDCRQQRCTWAFYLGETDVPMGAGSVMEFLALEFAFGELGIRKLCCEVFCFNKAVIKLHSKFGFQQEAFYRAHALKNGKFEDVVGLALFADQWCMLRSEMERLCFR